MLVYASNKSSDQEAEPADDLILELETMEIETRSRKLRSMVPVELESDLRCCWAGGNTRANRNKTRTTFEKLKEAVYVRSTRNLFLDEQDVTLEAGTFFCVEGLSTEERYFGAVGKKSVLVIERIVLSTLDPEEPNRRINYLYKRGSLVGDLFEPIRDEMMVLAIAAMGI